MAKPSADGLYVTVQKGDTLSQIAKDYGNGLSWRQLASLNAIPDANLIYVGQNIKLSGIASKTAESMTPKITHFGLQANTENTLFAVWSFGRKGTDHYETEWYYATGDGVWFVGNQSDVTVKQCTYSIPSNATQVKFRVKPVAKKITLNDKETIPWTVNWTDPKIFEVKANIIKPPSSAPTITMKKCQLTATMEKIDPVELNATGIEFQVIKKGKNAVYKRGKSTIGSINHTASYSVTVDAGCEYAVRCRSYRGNLYSDWTEFSEYKMSSPATPKQITSLKALSNTSVYISWTMVASAITYEIQYTTDVTYFDSSPDNVQSKTIEKDANGKLNNHSELTGFSGEGDEYFFRVRATNGAEDTSGWTGIKSIVLGKKPAPPTTWSSSSTVVTGEDLILYWIHNAEDGSSQTYAEIQLVITTDNGTTRMTKTIDNTGASDEDKDRTLSYSIQTSIYSEGSTIRWKVRTAGVTKEYGDWSTERTVTIYAQPSLELDVTDADGNTNAVFKQFPLYVKAIPGPASQAPIGYHLSIISNSSYQSMDELGNFKMVNAGEAVYSKRFDIKGTLVVELGAQHVNLDNGINYTVKCVVSLDSGLTAEASQDITVSWSDIGYVPNAEVNFDPDTLSAHIRPYCEYTTTTIYEVTTDSVTGAYIKGENTIDPDLLYLGVPVEITHTDIFGNEVVENLYTETGEQIYLGYFPDKPHIYYCYAEGVSLREDVTLSVYRREYDGSFTEIATDIDNTKNTFVTDPHPSLDYARYRIVATSTLNGSVGFEDLPGLPINEPSVIIQWAEDWTSFDINDEAESTEEPAWSGSLIKIPYNVDVSESNSIDVSLIEYIGRKNPVSYYGTQVGETSTWNVEIPKNDKETIYALRRLSKWMGDVYVREPSGIGYWASISVSFNQKHCAVTVPVTFNITRVEGGM